ncbi:MAG TPA: 4-alpha-glucanotransferase [Rhodocyclaceae bacterium]|nr:4-alpha-glucanotransferase [Rhodocyclaceae bacterium]
MSEALRHLAELCGILPDYHDIWGNRHVVSDLTRRHLLSAMHLPVDGDLTALALEFENRDWLRPLAPAMVLKAQAEPPRIAVTLPAALAQRNFEWSLTLESGESQSGAFLLADLEAVAERSVAGTLYQRRVLPLPLPLAAGYHRFELGQENEAPARMLLIVAPAGCYQPQAVQDGGRIWGPTVQLYGLRSQRNWGIGDFSDLAVLFDLTAASGAAIVGVNPLHALFPDCPGQFTPYSPSSRLFVNILYIDVEAVADFLESEAARSLVADPNFQARLRRLRESELVDYEGVTATKLKALDLAYQHFRDHHLIAGTERARAFRRYCAEQGPALASHALFEALQAHFRKLDDAVWGWPAWPQAYRDPQAPAVAAFARTHDAEVDFYAYLQWQAELQLGAACERSLQLCLGVGLYQDLAVGVNPGGAETWANQDVYAQGAHAGAPPDDFSLHGQDWGLPPFVPHWLRDAAYAPFIATLRANMRHCGALRIDHVMSLTRLFWVPAGASAAEGAYVSYPLDDLLGILALESQRNRCLVIGEDLGTVPDGLRPALASLGVLSYRPLFFARNGDNDFLPPAHYPDQALVSVGTHDLPTLRGFWRGHDLETRDRLELFPSEELRTSLLAARAQDRARLLLALSREGLLPGGLSTDPRALPEITPELAAAVHLYLARTPAKVMVVQPEDVFAVLEQTNLPGSVAEYPNWRRKLPLALERWREDREFRALGESLRRERGG